MKRFAVISSSGKIIEQRLLNTGYAFFLLFSFIALVSIACNPEEWQIVDCSKCYIDKPEEVEINVKLSINNLNPSVIIDIYSGKLEEGIIILSDTTRHETWNSILPVNEYYTVTATYRALTGNYMVTAIDGGMVTLRKVRSVCDMPCWIIEGNHFNVKQKY